MTEDRSSTGDGPLDHLDEWDDDVRRRYGPADADANTAGFRDYEQTTRESVREFYRLNHRHQTFEFVQRKRSQYLPLRNKRMRVWEALEFLNTLVDDSDPDLDLAQIDHALQTAESIRRDGREDWFILTGLIHDLGKVLCLFGEPQWAVVGDTFPVGCRFSNKIVFSEFFADNPDQGNPEYQTARGVYESRGGLDNVLMSWGHDEYLYQVVKEHLPQPAQYMIRYHSFYSAHHDGEYDWLMNDEDREMFRWVREFNRYDLYTKHDEPCDAVALRPYYQRLVDRFFPAPLDW